MDKNEFKVLLGQQPKAISLDDLTTEDIHRLRITVGHTPFETFFMPSDHKKLYVVFSAVGRDRRPYPIFQRVTWYESFEGMFLWVDDPTRDNTKIAPAYYFGTKDINYIELICDMIDKFIEIYHISYKDLTFISSSNGGFAALWCSRKMHGSTCLAYNPQLDIPLHYQRVRRKFETALNVSFEDESMRERFYLDDISEEKDSRICIYSNIKSPSDKVQMDAFFDKAGIKYKFGLQKVNNIWFIITSIDAVDTHLAQPAPYISRLLEQLMSDEWGGMVVSQQKCEIVDALLKGMKEYYALLKSNTALKNQLEALQSQEGEEKSSS